MEEKPRRFGTSLGLWALIGLVFGLALGVWGFKTGSPMVGGIAGLVRPFGILWLNSLQMAVVPLVILQLLVAVTGTGGGAAVGSAGRDTVVVILGLWALLALGSYFVSPLLVNLYTASPELVESVRNTVLIPTAAQNRAASGVNDLGEWLLNLVPSNAFQALLEGNLIQILIITVVFGLAVNRLRVDQRNLLVGVFQAVSGAVMVLVRWIIFLTPVGVFALVIGLASGAGFEAVGLLGAFVAMLYALHVIAVLSLYPIASLAGGVSLSRFAKAVAAPQLVGLSTRSSLASLPAQIESGRDHLGFDETTTGFSLPLCVTLFKARTAYANTLKLFFLAHVFGFSVGPAQFLAFIVTILLISFSAVGIPNSGGAFRPLPAYLAAGVPIEGYVIFEAVKDLTDYGDTLSNATGQFAVATILSRGDRAARPSPTNEADSSSSP